MQYTFEPYISANPNRIVLFQQPVNGWQRNCQPKLIGAEVRKNQNVLSNKSSKRLRNAIDVLVYASKYKSVYSAIDKIYYRFKVALWTLTLPSKQQHLDSEIHTQVLSPFLKAMVRKYSGMLYVWKSETQDNGNIHYHVTTNVFVHWKDLRAMWNKFVERLGYVSRSGLESPNSTDVHSVRNVKNLGAYMASYLTKKDLYSKVLKRYHRRFKKALSNQKRDFVTLPKNYFKRLKRKVDGVLWSASKALLIKPLLVHGADSRISDFVDLLPKLNDYIVDFDYCRIMFLESNTFNGFKSLRKLFNEHLNEAINSENEYIKSLVI